MYITMTPEQVQKKNVLPWMGTGDFELLMYSVIIHHPLWGTTTTWPIPHGQPVELSHHHRLPQQDLQMAMGQSWSSVRPTKPRFYGSFFLAISTANKSISGLYGLCLFSCLLVMLPVLLGIRKKRCTILYGPYIDIPFSQDLGLAGSLQPLVFIIVTKTIPSPASNNVLLVKITPISLWFMIPLTTVDRVYNKQTYNDVLW